MNQSKIISFSGIDGAGKSTQVNLLSKYLRSKGNKVLVTEEMFTYFLLKPLIGFLRSFTGSLPGGPVKRNKKSNWMRFWFIPAFIDIWLGYLFKTSPKFGSFDYVIADRFYTDIWANLLYYGYLPDWAFGIVKFLPKPDKALRMVVNPKVVQKREQEFPPDYYEEQAKIYALLGKHVDFLVVDANKNSKLVFEQIKQLLNI